MESKREIVAIADDAICLVYEKNNFTNKAEIIQKITKIQKKTNSWNVSNC